VIVQQHRNKKGRIKKETKGTRWELQKNAPWQKIKEENPCLGTTFWGGGGCRNTTVTPAERVRQRLEKGDRRVERRGDRPSSEDRKGGGLTTNSQRKGASEVWEEEGGGRGSEMGIKKGLEEGERVGRELSVGGKKNRFGRGEGSPGGRRRSLERLGVHGEALKTSHQKLVKKQDHKRGENNKSSW